MTLPTEIGSRIPTWVRKAGIQVLIDLGVGATAAMKVAVPVPEGVMVKDADGKERPAKKGEKRPLSEFVSERTLVPVIPFDKIPPECRMYRGKALRGGSYETTGVQPVAGGESPTPPLHPSKNGASTQQSGERP